MTPITAKDNVVRAQSLANAHGYPLLTDRQMHGTFDPIGGIDPGNLFFHPANPIERFKDACIH
jgi:hypothetical protein